MVIYFFNWLFSEMHALCARFLDDNATRNDKPNKILFIGLQINSLDKMSTIFIINVIYVSFSPVGWKKSYVGLKIE